MCLVPQALNKACPLDILEYESHLNGLKGPTRMAPINKALFGDVPSFGDLAIE